jgi:hypothetical protein
LNFSKFFFRKSQSSAAKRQLVHHPHEVNSPYERGLVRHAGLLNVASLSDSLKRTLVLSGAGIAHLKRVRSNVWEFVIHGVLFSELGAGDFARGFALQHEIIPFTILT